MAIQRVDVHPLRLREERTVGHRTGLPEFVAKKLQQPIVHADDAVVVAAGFARVPDPPGDQLPVAERPEHQGDRRGGAPGEVRQRPGSAVTGHRPDVRYGAGRPEGRVPARATPAPRVPTAPRQPGAPVSPATRGHFSGGSLVVLIFIRFNAVRERKRMLACRWQRRPGPLPRIARTKLCVPKSSI